MNNYNKVLFTLLEAYPNFVSGEDIAGITGITRSAIWQHIKTIRQSGYEIEGINNKGYRISRLPLMLDEAQVNYLASKYDFDRYFFSKSIDSTNTYAKSVSSEHDQTMLITCNEQTLGRGRLGRSWFSASGDTICFSLLLRPDITLSQSYFETTKMAVSICEYLNSVGIAAKIKWPNDIVFSEKKLCGILTEIGGEVDRVSHVIIGTGLNLRNADFPNDISDLAISVYNITGQIFTDFEVMDGILKCYKYQVKAGAILQKAKHFSDTLGHMVRITELSGDVYDCLAMDIDLSGALVVEVGGKVKKLMSGEVSLRRIRK